MEKIKDFDFGSLRSYLSSVDSSSSSERLSLEAQSAIQFIVDLYSRGDVSMAEVLADVPSDGLTIEEAFLVYVACLFKSDGDRFYRLLGTSDGELEGYNVECC